MTDTTPADTEQPRITTTPARPDEVFIHLPEFTYWDTQAWSAELGIPAAHLPALRDAITAHLGTAEDSTARPTGDGVTVQIHIHEDPPAIQNAVRDLRKHGLPPARRH